VVTQVGRLGKIPCPTTGWAGGKKSETAKVATKGEGRPEKERYTLIIRGTRANLPHGGGSVQEGSGQGGTRNGAEHPLKCVRKGTVGTEKLKN